MTILMIDENKRLEAEIAKLEDRITVLETGLKVLWANDCNAVTRSNQVINKLLYPEEEDDDGKS